MHYVSSPQVRWPNEIFETHPIPVSSRKFLISVGLPEVFEWPKFEFGVYDSDLPDLVIGEAENQPILIDVTTGIVWLEINQPAQRLFFNSSAELLSRFFYLVHEFQQTPDDDSSQQRAFAHMRSEMLELDPKAITTTETCIWTRWLDEWEMNLPTV
ncbi:SUKH-4 family immunity protein [Prosthecobacter fluviatilis]|uniref:SUKH-4 family immunity protein n=1 Tax=Prosthecobacter fluviatilis TaxID=445931 RepID=A0ABW0KQV3_9BACT